MEVILECKQLTKSYGSVRALDGIDLSIGAGKIVGLLGPNGSGKTTLIKLACGLLTPTGGSVRICDNPPGIKTKRQVAYLPDCSYLADWMTVNQILEYFADFYSDFQLDKAREMLDELKVDQKAQFKTLSKGTKEKVQLALVMSRRARLYLLDEPIGGVDPAAREYILRTIISNYCEDATVLISTHLIADVESVLDEAIFIHQGRILQHATVDDIRQQHNKSVDAYFREVFAC